MHMQNTNVLSALKTDKQKFLKHKIKLNIFRNCAFFLISKDHLTLV